MWGKAILLQLLLIFLVRDSHELHELKTKPTKRCEIFQLCEILPRDGKPVTQQQIERISGRVKNTKERIQNIELEKASQAESEQLKWRRRADKYCEAPEHKINDILGCDNLHISHENLAYFSELTEYCNELLRIAERGADNAELIEAVNDCEQKTHSLVIYKQFKRLRSKLEQHCIWEKKRQIADHFAHQYEERANKLRAEAKRYGSLIENSIRVEANNRVLWNLPQEQIAPLLKLLGEEDQAQEPIITEQIQIQIPDQDQDQDQGQAEVQEETASLGEAQLSRTNGLNSDRNDSIEVIDLNMKQDENLKTQTPEKLITKPVCIGSAEQCGDKLSFQLTKPEIGSLIKFLEDKAKADENDDAYERLKKELQAQIRTETNADAAMNVEFPESDVSKLTNILNERKELIQRNRQSIEDEKPLKKKGIFTKPIEFVKGLFGGRPKAQPQSQNGLQLQPNADISISI